MCATARRAGDVERVRNWEEAPRWISSFVAKLLMEWHRTGSKNFFDLAVLFYKIGHLILNDRLVDFSLDEIFPNVRSSTVMGTPVVYKIFDPSGGTITLTTSRTGL